MKRLRVLVAEDSLTVRRHLCEVLSADPGFEVVGEAADGKRAIELCTALRPDVVTLDMMMPVMTGLAAVEYLMAYCPTPILIVSASTNRGELFRTYEALAAGAVDVLEKPAGAPDGDAGWAERFRATVRLVARVRVIHHPRGRLALPPIAPSAVLPHLNGGSALHPALLAIGASTGGPGAILRVLQALPQLPWPALVVLHLGEPFAAAFAQWLSDLTLHPVAYAHDGQTLGPGVWLAPPGRHLLLAGGRLRLSDAPERHSCRPSVDVLFESLARECGAATVACLLTGMGRDGALGLRAIREAGGLTMAEDESSCVVYGMPREAAQIGAAQRILPLDALCATLREIALQGHPASGSQAGSPTRLQGPLQGRPRELK
jgi:two-component system chemotaxis response regulator CheB